jgi:4'-phosphopantetheinyl transferase
MLDYRTFKNQAAMQTNPFFSVSGTDVWFETLITDDADYQLYWQFLSIEEISIAKRFVQDHHRKRYVVSHGKLRVLLSRYLNISPENLRFARHKLGKPYLLDAGDQPNGLQFNLSHSSDSMLVGVGGMPLGIDIEVWDQRHDLVCLAEEILAPRERSYWDTLPSDQQVAAFYRYWTRKESLVKAVGCGIGVGLNRIVTSITGEKAFLALPEACQNTTDWRVFDLELMDGVSAALTLAT